MNAPAKPGTGRLPEDARMRLVQAAHSYPDAKDDETLYLRASAIDEAIRYAKVHYPQFFHLT